jgi:hypothetical protein
MAPPQPIGLPYRLCLAIAIEIGARELIDADLDAVSEALIRGDEQEATRLAEKLGIQNLDFYRPAVPSPEDDQRYLDPQFRKEQVRRLWHLIEVDPLNLVDPETHETLTRQEQADINRFCLEEGLDLKREVRAREAQEAWETMSSMEKAACYAAKAGKKALGAVGVIAKPMLNTAVYLSKPFQSILRPVFATLPREGVSGGVALVAIGVISIAGITSFFYLRPYR